MKKAYVNYEMPSSKNIYAYYSPRRRRERQKAYLQNEWLRNFPNLEKV